MITWQSQFLGNTLLSYAIYTAVLLVGLAIGKLLSWLIKHVIKAFTTKTKTKLDDVFVDVCDGPLIFAVFLGTFVFAARYLVFSTNGAHMYNVIARVLYIAAAAWILIRFLDSVIEHYIIPYSQTTKSDLDDTLVPIAH